MSLGSLAHFGEGARVVSARDRRAGDRVERRKGAVVGRGSGRLDFTGDPVLMYTFRRLERLLPQPFLLPFARLLPQVFLRLARAGPLGMVAHGAAATLPPPTLTVCGTIPRVSNALKRGRCVAGNRWAASYGCHGDPLLTERLQSSRPGLFRLRDVCR